MPLSKRFPHQNLDAFYLAVAARRGTWRLLAALPPGFTDDRRQLRRSSQAVTKLIGEAASRHSPGAKRQRFEEALGEVGETAAGLEELVLLGALELDEVDPVHALWGRTRGALLGIIKRI